MKKSRLFFGFVFLMNAANAQNSTQWPAVTTPTINTNNGIPAGYVGLGIRSTATSTTLPAFNFHVHGTADYIWQEPLEVLGISINYGKTVRFGMTNTTTGITEYDGTVFQMSGLNMTIRNLETGNMRLQSGACYMDLRPGGRLDIGAMQDISADKAKVNIDGINDNGLFIKASSNNKYGMAILTRKNSDAIKIFASDDNPTLKSFKVTGGGEVFARKYTTTLNNIPDYVFADDYQLMTFAELKHFIETKKHLPNIPSALEYEQNGVDLGEMNRLLLEKVEELTLYMLQLEERLKAVEAE